MKVTLLIFTLALINLSLLAQTQLPNYNLQNRGRFPITTSANTSIRQSSGLALDPNGTSFWTHNDQGYLLNKIYKFTPLAANTNNEVVLTDSVTIDTSPADWEEMAKDDNGNLYLLDIGKNCNAVSPPSCPSKYIFQIHQIPFASLSNGATFTPTTYFFKYPLTGYDINGCTFNDTVFVNSESAIWFNNSIYLFTKDIWSKNTPSCGGWSSDFTYLFKIPLQAGSSLTNPIDAQYMGKLNLRTSPSDTSNMLKLTAAALTPDKSTLALITYARIWLLKGFTGDNFFGANVVHYANYNDHLGVPLISARGYEGAEFKDNDSLFLSLDNANGRISSFNVNSPVPLPTENVNVDAYNSSSNQNIVLWQSKDDESDLSYDVEYSTDGIFFTQVNTLLKTATQRNKVNKFLHTFNTEFESSFYRIKIAKENGESKYSKTTVAVHKKKVHSTVTSHGLEILINLVQPSNYKQYLLFNANGQILSKGDVTQLTFRISVPQTGLYFLKIIGEDEVDEFKIQCF